MTSTLTADPYRTVAPEGFERLLGDRPDLGSHIRRLGPMAPVGSGLIGAVGRAGLTGRGGAGFPTARKLAAVAAKRGSKVVVANGTEGEPLSEKDKTLLVRSPHLVLDGLDAAARAVGAARRIVCIENGNPVVQRALATALFERGEDRVEIILTPRRYISGQEAALVDFIDGGPGRPSLDRPFERGVGGAATLIDNVETLAHLALIARFGPDWYRRVGTVAEPGSTLVTVAGEVTRRAVYEIPVGTSLAGLLAHAGSATPRGVLVGGYFGRWLTPSAVHQTSFDLQSLGANGASPGCGVVAVIAESCAVAELARVAAWYASSSAGQCGACTSGLRDLAAATSAVHAGTPDPNAPADIRRWSAMIKGRGACRLPDGAAAFLESGIAVFADEIAEHQRGRCTRPDGHLLPVPAPEAW